MPAQPAPITSTSCLASTSKEATESVAPRSARTDGAGGPPPAPSLPPLRRVGADCVWRHGVVRPLVVVDGDVPARAVRIRIRLRDVDLQIRVADIDTTADGELAGRTCDRRRAVEV